MMRNRDVHILTSNRLLLVKNMKVTDILLSCLRQDYTLTDEMTQEIKAEKKESSKAGVLLDILPRRGEKAFDRFIWALVETRQDGLACKLDEKLAKRYIEERNSSPQIAEPIDTECVDSNPGLPRGISIPWAWPPGVPMMIMPVMPPNSSTAATNYYTYMTTGCVPIQPPTDDVEGPKYSDVEWKAIMDDINASTAKAEMEIKIRTAVNTHLANNFQKVYPMKNKPRGRAVIINIEYFTGNGKKLNPRDGSQHDITNLKKMFEQLSFKVITENDNLTAEEIIAVLKKESQHEDHNSADMFILFLLSHGSQGKIFGMDCVSLSIEEEITTLFSPKNCPALKGKPKIFFIQACQGNLKSSRYGHDGDDAEHDAEKHEPPEDKKVAEMFNTLSVEDKKGFVPGYNQRSDIVMSYATVKGYLAWRRADLGSWFVRCLVSVFSRRAHQDDLLDMLTQVNYLLHQLETSEKDGRCYQLAEKTDSLIKKLYFFPGFNAS